jgi:YbbR domain-containing protein
MVIVRWLLNNSGSLTLALVLSLLVWGAAVNEDDPLITQEYPGTVEIEFTNIEPGYLIVGDSSIQGTMVLRAPTSVWAELSPEDLHLVADMSGLEEGSHSVEISPMVDINMVRVISYEPTSYDLVLEPSQTRQMGVEVVVSGDPAIGFGVENAVAQPLQAMIEGPGSTITLVDELQARVDVAGRNQNVTLQAEIVPVDSSGNVVSDVIVTPATATVQVTIAQQSGYRSVAVVPVIQGRPAFGYWVKNITYSPTAVTLQSSDPQAVDLLPGYVETVPVVLTDARETIEQIVLLSLPEGFTVIGDPSITLVVTIEALETSITVIRTLEISGLEPGFAAEASPETVSVILIGPQPILDGLQLDDVIVVVDLVDIEPGVHQIVPQVVVLLSDVEVQAVLPESIEVTITELATPTPGN